MKPGNVPKTTSLRVAAALPLACAAWLWLAAPSAAAQAAPEKHAMPKDAPGASGIVVVPPAADPGMSKQAPANGDPEAIKPPPASAKPEAVKPVVPNSKGKPGGQGRAAPEAKAGAAGESPAANALPARKSGAAPSVKDSCKGRPELCKQDSAR